ncbi:MAG: carbohydrate-binding domain-containing protein, partial [Clostridia bacterium]|nr:carbohydrate-binding domain-containing protein [Clostridia bacterium]
MKKIALILLAVVLVASLVACDGGSTNEGSTNEGNTNAPVTDTNGNVDSSANTDAESAPADEQTNSPADTNGGSDESQPSAETPAEPSTIVLTFNGTNLSTSVADTGITVEGGAFVITRGGTYELKGDLSGGQIKVAVAKTEQVELIFNNFTASCNTSAPLYIASADKCVINLAAGSVNTLTDATLYQYANPGDDKPNA